jgi:predicted DsbA family dithiol-disulfide isomerase/uncharacterized membrane protein
MGDPKETMSSDSLRNRSSIASAPFVLGCLCLLTAASASFMLSLEHVGQISLPGCGEHSACAKAIAGRWGSVPIIHWPVAFLGFAYFTGMMAAWFLSRSGISLFLRNIAALGALFSLAFTTLVVIERTFCYYCLAAHAANFCFYVIIEKSRGKASLSRRTGMILIFTFMCVSIILAAVFIRTRKDISRLQEKDRKTSAARVIAADKQRAASKPKGANESIKPWSEGFTGRYHLGPAKAAARIVMITDYQCRDCVRFEKEALALASGNQSVSLSIKHFPMCTGCNPYIHKNLHPNACWAARAAETAGILKGNEGFFQMHQWLFERNGTFDDKQLRSAIREFGFNEDKFISVMTGEETLALVHADIEEAMWLGLHYTPMIFVNGIELRGIFASNALIRTVTEVLSKNPPELNALRDHPPPALEKCVADWREQPARILSPDNVPRMLGPKNARLQVVVWGDFQEPNTVDLDGFLRKYVGGCNDASYTYRHYPVSRECNPETTLDKHPLACLAARGAEAAGQMGGEPAYWKMHIWLMDNRNGLSNRRLLAYAAELGFDTGRFSQLMESEAVTGAINEDCSAARRMNASAIPLIFVNNKIVPRWRFQGGIVLDSILRAALEE